MVDKALSAGPEDPEPIVTPKPAYWRQFDPGWGRVLMRPSIYPIQKSDDDDGHTASLAEQSQTDSKGDTWGASGCHPTSVAMTVQWYRTHPKFGSEIVLPHGGPAGNETVTPQHIWKWIHDADATAPCKSWTSEHRPPWVPFRSGRGPKTIDKTKYKKILQQFVEHGTVSKAPVGITWNGKKLILENSSWPQNSPNGRINQAQRDEKKSKFKRLLHQCGPLPINMLNPAHFVLLWGYRGKYMFILDCGYCLYKWVMTHKDWPKGVTSPDAMKNLTVTDSQTGQVVARFFDHGGDLMIDGEYVFNLGAGKFAFLDSVFTYDGFRFEGQGPFDEFLSNAGPEGAPAPSSTAPVPSGAPPTPGATPSTPGATPPAPGGTPSSGGPTTPGSTSPQGSAPSGADPAPAPGGSQPSAGNESDKPLVVQVWDWLLGKLKPSPTPAPATSPGGTSPSGPESPGTGQPQGNSGGNEPGSPGVTPAPVPAPASAAQVRAVVTVIDDETEKPVKDVEVEVVGVDKGKTDAKGKWASRAFDAGTYNVKTRKSGYGPPNSDKPTSGGETAQSVAFADNQEISVRMRDVTQARGFIWVLEDRSRRLLSGIETEIVGIDMGPTDDKGKWVSKSFAPGNKWVKTRKAGWGPASGAPVEGETAQQVNFGKGDRSLVVYMQDVNPFCPPPPDGYSQDTSQLRIRGPEEIDHDSFTKGGQAVRFTADPAPSGLHPLAKWKLYDPGGTCVDENAEPLGTTYDLEPELIKSLAPKAGGSVCGRWTLHFERGDYYHDYHFFLVGPKPDTGPAQPAPSDTPQQPSPKPPTPATPSAPSTPSSPPNSSSPGQFNSTGYNEDARFQVSSTDMAQAYADVLKQNGTVPSRKMVLILTAQWDFETGGGRGMHWYNAGNIKYTGTKDTPWTQFKCSEWIKESSVEAFTQKTPAGQFEVTDESKMFGTVLMRKIYLVPPHAGSRFRAYPNLFAGVLSHVNTIRAKRFKLAYEAALAEDIEKFGHELRAAGYYTDDEKKYTNGLKARYAALDKKIKTLNLA